MKILLFGGSGFVGRHIWKIGAQNKNYMIYAPTHFECDVTKYGEVKYFVDKLKPDVIIKSVHSLDVAENACITYNIYDMAKNVKKIFNLSSGAIYDRYQDVVDVREFEIGKNIPKDPYGYGKYVEYTYGRQFPNIIDLFLFGIFGTGELPTRFLTSAINRVLDGKPPIIHGDRKMSWIGADVFSRVLFKLIETPFIPHHLNMVSFTATLTSLLDVVAPIIHNENSYVFSTKELQKQYSADNSLLWSVIGDKLLAEGVEKDIRNMYDDLKEEHDAQRLA